MLWLVALLGSVWFGLGLVWFGLVILLYILYVVVVVSRVERSKVYSNV